jgi:hypothetical protein
MYRSDRFASVAAIVLVAVSVSACAMFETGQTKLQAVKTVGIISAVGDEITLAQGGLTGLNNRSQSFPIASWGLDDLIVQQATTALNGRFQVQPVRYNRAAFTAIKDSPVTPVNLVRGDPFKKLVQTEASPQGLDAYIVITKAKSNLTYGTVMESYNQVHVLYEIRVVDGKTFEVIEKMTAPPLDDGGQITIAGPSRRIDEISPADTVNPAENQRLRAAIADLVARSLSTTLSDMHLADIR